MRNGLEHLTPTDLLLLQKHVKLGKNHLKDRLTEQEISQIYKLRKIDKQTERQIAADTPELMGSASLMINTIFTTILGAWMGISGFLEYRLDSFPIFLFLLLSCILIGGSFGYSNYQSIKRATDEALEQRKTKAIETQILHVLNQKREQELKESFKEIEEILKNLQITDSEFLELPIEQLNDSEVCLNLLNQMEHATKELQGNESAAFISEVEKIKNSLQSHLIKEQKRKKEELTQTIHKLKNSSLPFKVRMKSWIRKNLRLIIVSIIPVVLGGFSSLFVYFGGAPKLAQEMGRRDLFYFLSQPYIKHIEVIIALGITIYFTFVFFHTNYKAFKRDQELTKMNDLLTQEEAKLELLDDKILKINRIAEILKPIDLLYRVLRQTNVSLKA